MTESLRMNGMTGARIAKNAPYVESTDQMLTTGKGANVPSVKRLGMKGILGTIVYVLGAERPETRGITGKKVNAPNVVTLLMN